METLIVPAALHARLGDTGTEGLVEMFSAYQSFATDRYERRLMEVEAGLRQELRDGLAGLRLEMAETKADIIKWTLVMWIGQFAALAAVMAFLLRPR